MCQQKLENNLICHPVIDPISPIYLAKEIHYLEAAPTLNVISMWSMGDLQVSSATTASAALLQQCSPHLTAMRPTSPPPSLPFASTPRWPALWQGALVSRSRISIASLLA